MYKASSLLLKTLNAPEDMSSLSLSSWDVLIRQARAAGLLANLSISAEKLGILDAIPERPRNHLISARILTDKHKRDVKWEVRCILEALERLNVPVTLLKGAAYLMSDYTIADGRFFSDVDILVPKSSIDEVEATLRIKGWLLCAHDEYDQRYYRKWMHELPPLRHGVRNTTLDVHHNILPETARLHPDPEKLLSSAVVNNQYEKLYVLSPEDMVLHSATHLFHDGELEHGLRDLVDLDGLFRHFSQQKGFWAKLELRAVEMDLTRPLYYALRYCNELLQTPVPATVFAGLGSSRPPFLIAGFMDALFSRALAPVHASCSDRFTKTARLLLFIRAHYLRMPLHLLIPHLFHKAFITEKN